MEHRLKADVIAVAELSFEQQKMMAGLYGSYYDGFDEILFYQDLSAKHWAILLIDENNKIRGFTTLFVGEHCVDENGQQFSIRSIFSGDTIIHHDYWGEQALPHAWCKFIGVIKAQQPDVPLYWFLIVKGHRTYRYLRIFSKEFYPVSEAATPSKLQKIMDKLGNDRFGSNYHSQSGLIQYSESHGYLKQKWSGIDEQSLTKSDVKFFLKKNPNYQLGDELVCLTELTESNLQRYALSAFREGLSSV